MTIGRNTLIIILVILGTLVPPLVILNHYYLYLLIWGLVCVQLLLAFNLMNGYLGRTPFSAAATFGIGAYIGANLTIIGVNFWIALPVSGLLTAAIGALILLPANRLRGLYFIIFTVLLQVFFEHLFLVVPYTKGAFGIGNIPPPTAIAINGVTYLSFVGDVPMYYLILGFTLLFTGILYPLLRSNFGKALVAIRDDELLAESYGVNTTLYKEVAYTISSFFWGLTGMLFVSYIGFASTGFFGFNLSIELWIWLTVAGTGFFAPFLGAAVFIPLESYLVTFVQARLFIEGAIVLIFILFYPDGLLGMIKSYMRYSKRQEKEITPNEEGK